MTKDKFIEVLEAVNAQVCAYTMPHQLHPATFCDCKFHQQGRGITLDKTSEVSNGCPELRRCISLIDSITDAQFNYVALYGKLPIEQRQSFWSKLWSKVNK